MRNKIQIKICVGTTCYVMGASDILTIQDELTPSISDRVEVLGIPCFDLCKNSANGKAPFVSVNDIIIDSASLDKVKEYILELTQKL